MEMQFFSPITVTIYRNKFPSSIVVIENEKYFSVIYDHYSQPKTFQSKWLFWFWPSQLWPLIVNSLTVTDLIVLCKYQNDFQMSLQKKGTFYFSVTYKLWMNCIEEKEKENIRLKLRYLPSFLYLYIYKNKNMTYQFTIRLRL